MNPRWIPALLTPLLLLGAALPAASASQVDDTDASDYSRVQGELAHWRALHGESWQVVFDKETGHGAFLHGGLAQALFVPASDADFYVLARQALLDTQPIHGLEISTLVENGVVFLPLGLAGSSDKISVEFRQEEGGARVLSGYANVLFDTRGNLLSVDATGLPRLAGFPTTPTTEPGEAVESAVALFAQETGLAPTHVTPGELAIEQARDATGKLRVPRLVWQVEVAFEGAGAEPAGFVYRIDAHDRSLVSKRSLIHTFDVSGNVKSMATPGAFPDQASNPETQQPMPHLRVTSPQGNAVTDSAGNFTIVGASAPLQVTLKYEGTFCNTQNQSGADYSLVTTLNSASGNNVLMNPASAAQTTAEANSLNWIGKMRDWTRSINPSDATCDFLATSNVNLAQTCNAFYNGSSVNFYLAGGGCANTSYSSVVLHEMGHWLNDRYGSGNGGDGFGEGNADNFSTYVLEDPIVGHDFCGPGCNVRDANNNRPFCGDCCGGCYGEVHADGEVLMGACWKVRTRLKNAHGAAAGAQIANVIFNSWMNAYNDTQIKTIIETHWLTLDDDDGNINNGTPNYAHIDGGFKDQSFPGFQLSFVTITNVTQLPDTQNETGPYAVSADVTALFNPPITAVDLHYRVNGGAFQILPMGLVSGSTYSAGIPGQQSPAKVDYYVSGTDNAGQSSTFPSNAPSSVLEFVIGIKQVLYTTSFETGTAGWTHGSPNGTQDDWMLSSAVGVNTSFGKSGDPTTAATGTNIWGNDLGPSGWNGAYGNNVSNFLRSPLIDCSQAVGTSLSLQRWLMVEAGVYDQARIKVNGQQVFINPGGSDLIDTSWNSMEIDISAIADGNPAVQIEFAMVSDVGVTFGGWNIDDVEVSFVAPSCPAPVPYCTAKVSSSLLVPAIGWTGTPSLAAGNFAVTLADAEPQKNCLVFWGTSPNAAPFHGGYLCALPPLVREPLQQTSASGTASQSVAITAPMVGVTRYYQWWFRDPPDPFTDGLSNGLEVTFCD